MGESGHPSPSGEERIRRALLWSLGVVALLGTGIAIAVALRAGDASEVPAQEHDVVGPAAPRARVATPSIPFTNIAAEAGVVYQHENGAYGERLLPETMGGGVAFFDYDGDGDQDLLLVNSMRWPWRGGEETPLGAHATSRLFRNRGDGAFEDVSTATGMDLRLYGMGAAIGDYDGDGWLDVFVTALGGNRLLRNVGGQRFVDVTAQQGVGGAEDAWSTGATFLDYDRDGDLDLFVCNYVQWSPAIDRAVDFRLTAIGRAYGPPTDFAGANAYLYRNDGATFADVSAAAGVEVANPATGAPMGKALAVLPLDANRDGWPDLAVANDTVQNFLFVNQGDGSFVEAGIDAGIAFDATGSATGAMGIDAARYDNDDKLAIAIGNFANEMSSFYVARPGEGVFSDDAIVAGIGAPSRRGLTFGLAFFDADLDGRLDLLAANGHVEPDIGRVQASQRYAQRAQLFWNCGADCQPRYALVEAAGDLAIPRVGRGLAYADIDGDGDLDLAITEAGGPAALLRNDSSLGHAWVRLTLRGETPNRHAIGAEVTLTAGGFVQHRTVTPTRSYLSQVELPLVFGLGDAARVEAVSVRWPNGTMETWRNLAIRQTHTLRLGGGE